MSQEQNASAAATRLQIREVSAGTGDGDSLANLNTAVLPDGALVMVSGEHTIYELVKASSLPALAGLVVVPASGPGRWVRFATSNGFGGSVSLISGAPVAFPATGDFAGSTSSAFTLDQGASDHPDWALTALGGRLTYTGPTRPFIGILTAQVAVGDASSARDVYGGIVYLGAPNSAVGPTGASNGSHCATAAVPYPLSVVRRMVISTGQEVQPQFGVASGASTLSVNLQLDLIPA